MSEFYNEDENLKTKIDFKLLKRLLKYTKPYRLLIFICILFIIVSTICDVGKPYLMKVAMDDHIGSYGKDMYYSKTPIDPDKPYIYFKGNYYTRISHIEKDSSIINTENLNKAHIEKVNDKYFLVNNLNDKINLSKNEYASFRKEDKKGIFKISLLFLLLLTLGFISNYVQTYVLNYTGQKIIYTMRMELFDHVQKLPLSFFDKNPVGKIVTRLTNDMENINEMFTSVVVTFLKDLSLLSFTMVAMFLLNYKVALVCFSTLPLILVASFLFRKKARDANRKVKAKLSKINISLNENIMGMKTIQIFAREKSIFRDFNKINESHKKASMKELSIFAIFRPGMDLIYNLTLALLIWFSARNILNGLLEFGVLFAFINYIEQFFNPIFDLSEKLNILQSAMTSTERVFSLLDVEFKSNEIKNPINLPTLKGSIEFKNVWFKYDKEWILKDVSFKINEGETVAFVGATGSGKTTIISLIAGFYEIQKGEILIDGININNMRKSDLRKQIGTVLQDVFLFSSSIKDNIRLSNKEISTEKIKKVCDFVNASNFIEKLPEGYNYEVRERGVTFSSGERQLLSFARALVFDPSILILDEATANIDTETESLIQDAISKVTKNRTTIVVAHRLSTIQNANKIIVLHKGVLRESGTHEELLKMEGIYYNLHRLQYASN